MAGKGGGARGKGGKAGGKGPERGLEMGRELSELDDSSVQLESKLEILRAERAAQRSGRSVKHDTVREDEGVDEADPLNNMDDGVRLEPFNMRREMAEGHFDEAGMYILNKDEEKEVTDAWLDTVDQAEKTATFQQEERYKKAQELAASRLSALKKNLGKDADEEEEQDDDAEGCWIVEIDKSSGGRLGFGLDVKHSEGKEDRIEIECIDDDGLFAAWNKANPTKAVEPGDRILQLNGESSTEAITTGLREQQILKIKFIREEKPEEPEEEKETSVMIETLVNALMPLETPTMALARLTKGGSSAPSLGRQSGSAARAGMVPLKMRARMKKDRLTETTKPEASSTAATASDLQKQGKKRLNEWGDYESGSGPKEPKLMSNGENGAATSGPSEMATDTVVSSGGDVADNKEQSANDSETSKPPATTSSIPSDKEAAIAAAAEKAAAEDKAVAEVAAAAKAEARMSRHNLYQALDMAKGPEAAALVEAKKRESGESTEERPSAATLAAAAKKRSAEPGILEQARRAKIEKLTDLCDRLLERGVLVYDSTREQLAIEFRERRGEFEEKEGAEEGPKEEKKDTSGETSGTQEISKEQTSNGAEQTAGASSSSASDAVPKEPAVTFVNKRFTPASSQSDDSAPSGLLGLLSNEGGKVDPDAETGSVSATRNLMWQFRWESTPEQSHGPFDSVTMHGWMTQGCFSEERNAEVRQCDESNSPTEQCWHPMMEMNFELYF